jgi:hypothetical protein
VGNPAARDLATQLFEIYTEMKDKLLEAQDRKKDNAKIWLLRRNLKTNRPYDKLDFRRFGPFSVVKQINDIAFRLELPPSMKIHPVFHFSLLEPYMESSIVGRFQVPPPLVEIDSRIIRRKLEYLVQWQGYDISERTWEPVANLHHASEMLQEFHCRYSEKPNSKHA